MTLMDVLVGNGLVVEVHVLSLSDLDKLIAPRDMNSRFNSEWKNLQTSLLVRYYNNQFDPYLAATGALARFGTSCNVSSFEHLCE